MMDFEVTPEHLKSIGSYVVFDIETTGLSRMDKIIQIAGLKIKEGKVYDTFNELINPEINIPAKIQKLTGITNQMVENKGTFHKILPIFYDFIKDDHLIAHNAEFDYNRFLVPYMKCINIIPNNKVYCTKKISKALIKSLASYRLNKLCEYFCIQLKKHHNALCDVEATYLLFEKLKKMDIENSPIENLKLSYLPQIANTPEIIYSSYNTVYKYIKISYWSKYNHKRLYVKLDKGTLFYDLIRKKWNNDIKNIDLSLLEHELFVIHKCKTINQLCKIYSALIAPELR